MGTPPFLGRHLPLWTAGVYRSLRTLGRHRYYNIGMILDAEETDGLLIEAIVTGAGAFSEEEVDALGAVWAEFLDLGAEDSGYEFLVEREGGAVLGFVCYGPRELTDGVFDLVSVAVGAAALRQGIGRRLLRAGEGEARDAGARMVMAETSGEARHAAIRSLLLSAGYEVEATIKDFYTVGDDLNVFIKRF
jgi:ribosomal protein S18 acetylase RimI-like enzyme